MRPSRLPSIDPSSGRRMGPIVVEQLMVHARFAGQEAADEAATSSDTALVGDDIERDALGHSPRSIQALEKDIRDWISAWNPNPSPGPRPPTRSSTRLISSTNWHLPDRSLSWRPSAHPQPQWMSATSGGDVPRTPKTVRRHPVAARGIGRYVSRSGATGGGRCSGGK